MRRQWARLLAFGVPALAVGFVLGLVAGGAIVLGLYKTNTVGGPKAKPQLAAYSEVSADLARELAARFRPRLMFDSDELWRPLNIARLFAERLDGAPAHKLCAQGRACEPVAGEAEFTALVHEGSAFGGGQHLDLAGRRKFDYRGPGACKPLLDCGKGPGSAIYYHVTTSSDRYYVDYWWFLRFNNFYRTHPSKACRSAVAIANSVCDEHEGDLEGVTVVTPPDSPRELDYVVYAAHKGTFRYAASGLKLHGGTRPDVFLAQGSHAAYAEPCAKKDCAQPGALAAAGLLKLPEGRFDGQSPWERNDEHCEADTPASCLLALPRTVDDPRSWTVWAGQWGAGCEQACDRVTGPTAPRVNSPRSPGVQQRYQTPGCSLQGAAQTCDGKALSCSDWLGPLVAVVGCNPGLLAKAFASTSERDAGHLKVTVSGRGAATESSPGIVQSLGDPLKPGMTVTVTGGTSTTQLLVRAQLGERIIEARFGKLGLGEGRSAVLKIKGGPAADDVIRLLAPGGPSRDADELRIVKSQPAAPVTEPAA